MARFFRTPTWGETQFWALFSGQPSGRKALFDPNFSGWGASLLGGLSGGLGGLAQREMGRDSRSGGGGLKGTGASGGGSGAGARLTRRFVRMKVGYRPRCAGPEQQSTYNCLVDLRQNQNDGRLLRGWKQLRRGGGSDAAVVLTVALALQNVGRGVMQCCKTSTISRFRCSDALPGASADEKNKGQQETIMIECGHEDLSSAPKLPSMLGWSSSQLSSSYLPAPGYTETKVANMVFPVTTG
ncbi:hypothetical protein OBBRIDRAFT_807848 [Obba rivulosa]|uniref:Uncharacterized protein n=1 Tax=Obba rivulosa TaxID=1052685 RepID=A0A8E2ANE2_9APHY|nr:hypothetical protein OBBRIDRAFT_807848 [Obba rivulosa]